MKSKYQVASWSSAIIFLVIQGFFVLTVGAQTNAPVSVGPSEHFFDNTPVIRQKPTQYPFGAAFNQNEMHILGGLTVQERKGIEEAVEPPAIGVVRDLKDPVHFISTGMEAPAMGEQRFVSGGRLVRINADTLAWSSYFKSEGAEELRLFFSEGNFPAGVKVNLFSKDGYAFTQSELTGQVKADGFYTTTTFADYVILQVVIPVSALNENLNFIISKVIHANARPLPDAPNVTCYQDVNCAYANGFASIGALKAATAQLTFVVGGFYYICTGGLLNDIRAIDLQPFLLTANHCFSTQASAASLEATFDLFSTSCNGPTNPSTILINGSNLISTNSQSDFTLVLLNSNPGGYRWYLGWSAGGVANDETVHSVNHPGGIPQKYMRGLNKTSPDFSCGGLSTSNFHYSRALGGESEGGSSGGNLVNSGGYVIGQLYGWCYLTGATTCDYPTFYNVWGKFEVSYNNNNLGYWLYNGGSSVSMTTSTSSVNFGTGNVGYYYYQNVTVTNNGYVPYYLNLEAGNSYISGPDASQFTITGGGYLYLAPGASGTIYLRFNPTSSGAKSATLNIPHNANNISSPKLISLTGSAEPCSDIISLGSGGAANAKTYSKSGSGIWYTSWATPCGYSCPGNEQIYSIVAPYTGYYSIDVSASNYYYLDYMWKEAVCDGGVWNCFDDIAVPGTFGSAYWIAGNTYYVLADAESTTTVTQTFAVIYNPCLNTIPIGGTGPDYTQTYTGGGNGAWSTSSTGACGYYCPGVENVYTFVAPYSGYYSLQVTGTTEWYVDYSWSTSCGATGWNCIHDVWTPGTYGSMYWTSGTTYYILADDEDGIAGAQTFYINPPDPCIGVIPIACNQAVEFHSGGEGVWNTYSCWSSPGAEQVYSFVAPTTGQYSLQVNAASNWVDYMWSTSCTGPWTCISYVSSPGQYGSMSWTAGTTYYILADDEDFSADIQSFQLICPELCHATCSTYDFLIYPYPTWQTSYSSIDSYGCKIYKIYANVGYSYTFKTGCGDGAYADYDTYLLLYDAACNLVTYDDDGCGYPLSKIEWTPAVSGYYYLKVQGYSNYFGSYSLAYNYCYSEPSQPDPISGPTVVGSGETQSYSIPEAYQATSYTWSYSGTGSITGSGTSIQLTPTSDGTLSVVAHNLCGTSLSTDLGITVIPAFLNVQNIVVSPGSSVCYAATQTLTVGGSGTYYYVLNGGSAEFVAGHNIFFKPGVTVYSGGNLHGWITTNGTYCSPPVAKFAENSDPGTKGNNPPLILSGGEFFKVYPNPTTGDFTLELSSEPDESLVKVQCYNLLGELIMEKEFTSGKKHKLTLENQKPGMYMLKVVQNASSGMQKIIRE